MWAHGIQDGSFWSLLLVVFHITSYHIMSFHIISYHTTSRYITSPHLLKWKVIFIRYTIITIKFYVIIRVHSAFSLVASCVYTRSTHARITSTAGVIYLANLFRGSSHDFCQLYYNIKQIDFIFLCFCTVIDHRWRHSVWRTKSHALDYVSCVLFCSSHAMTSVICDLLQYRRANVTRKCFNNYPVKSVFPHVIRKYTKFANFTGL